jgi:hypothetical protein
MTNLRKFIHPEGASNSSVKRDLKAPLEVDTFDGKVHVEWDPDASVTPLGQLPFFIQFLTVGKRFDPWIDDCPLALYGLKFLVFFPFSPGWGLSPHRPCRPIQHFHPSLP